MLAGGELIGSQPSLITAPGRFGLSPPACPPWTFARRFGMVSWEGRRLCDGRGDDEVLGTCLQRARGDADPRDWLAAEGLGRKLVLHRNVQVADEQDAVVQARLRLPRRDDATSSEAHDG